MHPSRLRNCNTLHERKYIYTHPQTNQTKSRSRKCRLLFKYLTAPLVSPPGVILPPNAPVAKRDLMVSSVLCAMVYTNSIHSCYLPGDCTGSWPSSACRCTCHRCVILVRITSGHTTVTLYIYIALVIVLPSVRTLPSD